MQGHSGISRIPVLDRSRPLTGGNPNRERGGAALQRTTRSRGTLFNQQRHTSVALRIEPPISQCRFPSRITAAITRPLLSPSTLMYTRKGGGISFADHPCSFIKLKLCRPCTTWPDRVKQAFSLRERKSIPVGKPFSRRTNFSSFQLKLLSLFPFFVLEKNTGRRIPGT